ncbi:hypothetical protein SprV_0100417200 [Sparganum proliferum]
MGLFGYMRIHESGIDRSPDTPTTSNTPTMPSPTLASPSCAPITTSSVADTVAADFSCPHCPRTFPLASAWSVTCESIAQRLANQCLEYPATPIALASTAHTVLAHSRIAWAFSATCASTNTCGRQLPAAPHHHTLPASPPLPRHTSTLTHRKHPTTTSHASGKCASRLGPRAASAAQAA